MNWHDIKQWMEHSSGLDMDALHVYAGVLLQLAAAAVLKRTLKSPWPWLVVLVAIACNEAYDLHYEVWPSRAMQYGESIKDGWNTMLMPTLLLLLTRFAPRLFWRPDADLRSAAAAED